VEEKGHHDDNTEHVDNGLLHRSKVTQEEHPLSLGKTSVWNQFFEVHWHHLMVLTLVYIWLEIQFT
jgi:hypothetical protein